MQAIGGIEIKELFYNFGAYNFRARISVGIILFAPCLLQIYLLIPEMKNLSSTIVIAIIFYGLCNLIIVYCRNFGVKAMKKCFPNMLPAQEYLLPSNSKINAVTKQRYYNFFLKHIDGFKIFDNDNKMIPYVSTAITWLISKTRDAKKFPLIAEENMNFGFSYNLLGLKPFGITICILGVIFTSLLTFFSLKDLISINICKTLISLIVYWFFFFLWIFVITKKLVISAGQKYASALLSACDSDNFD